MVINRKSPACAVALTLASAGIALVFWPQSTLAQTASQITPRSFEPPLQGRGGGIVIPQGAGPEAPAGADKLSVRIKAVRIDGGLPALAGKEREIRASLSGRRVSAAALFDAAKQLEQAYIAAGYGLVRVVLPAQSLVDGATLRLQVIDGFVERLDTSRLPPAIRARIDALLGPLVGRRAILLRDVERRLLLAGDLPGTVLRSTLAPGTAPGAGVLLIEARYKPVTGFVSLDNTLSQSLGRYGVNAGLDINSPTGHGELIYLRTGGLPWARGDAGFIEAQPRNRLLAAGVTLPLGNDGLTLNLEATDARATPVSVAGGLGITSDFTRYSARLRYPVLRGRDLTLNLEAGFDAQDDQVTVITPLVQGLSLDRLRIARAGGDLSWFAPGNALVTARLTGSFGIDGLGARAAPPVGSIDVPLSRDGAGPAFQKLEAQLGYNQPLLDHLTLDFRARGQTSFGQPLLRSEQIGLAGGGALSTFDSGLIQGDAGYVVRGETQFPFATAFTLPFAVPSLPPQQGSGLPTGDTTPGAAVITPYAFGAFGQVTLEKPSALEIASIRGMSYGLGLRLGAAPQSSFSAMNIAIEYGRYERSAGLGSGDRLTFSTTFQF